MPSHIEKFVLNPFQENTLIIHDGEICVIVDPGCYERNEQEALVSYIEENNLKPLAVLLTHAHIDHVLGVDFITTHFQIPYYLHEMDLPTLEAVGSYAHMYGFPGYRPPQQPDVILKGGEELEFGALKFSVYFTPGHCTGHVVYHNKSENYVVNGDVLFAGSFGRVDLPGGDLATLKDSIFNTMFNLPDETIVFCGHGPETTIGKEKQTNYILQF